MKALHRHAGESYLVKDTKGQEPVESVEPSKEKTLKTASESEVETFEIL